MPEYLAPGVYVEETSFRAKSIEGVSTSTAGFVGPARFGPTDGAPELVTSLADFERIFGSLDPLTYDTETDPTTNYLAHGVRAFFDNGGARVYISRIYTNPSKGDGYASVTITSTDSLPVSVKLRARYPGRAGDVRVAFRFRVGKNVLTSDDTGPVLRGVGNRDTLWLADAGSTPLAGLYWAQRYFDEQQQRDAWRLHGADGSTLNVAAGNIDPALDTVQVVTCSVEVTYMDAQGVPARRQLWENVTFHPGHPASLSQLFAATLTNRSQQLTNPIVFDDGGQDALTIARVLLENAGAYNDVATADQKLYQTSLTGGSDGARPPEASYDGDDVTPTAKTGLKALEDIDDISIVAAPGYSMLTATPLAVCNYLINHAEKMRYRVAILDSVEGQGLADIRGYRAQLDSTRAALYYPFVRILDPVTDEEINLPPSGFLAGIYARSDIQNGVHKSPANEVVRDALGFEMLLNKAQQDVLNPENINVLRYFEGRGYRVWGARTASSDPEWKYINVRRYFIFLEHSIDKGTQWVVFENNGDDLWANVRRTIEDFLFNEWKSGHLFGAKPEEAYFVRCDRTTMTQNDFDNGRLVCLIGVSPLRPAEFVIFRIGQWTADSRR